MVCAPGQIVLESSPSQRPPGFLLAPFGWATGRVIAALQYEPGLLADLIFLSRTRMHLIALALAHAESDAPAELRQILFHGSAGDILDAAIGRRPVGLKRVIQCLPGNVLEAESYRRLVQLLDDPAASKLLYQTSMIDDPAIKMFDDIPAVLRSVVLPMQAQLFGIYSLGDGLRYLVRRGAAPSFDALLAEFADVRQPEQLVAKIKSIVEALPLPDALPTVQVGLARRIDHATDLRKLAKRWKNCLESYIWRVDEGGCAIYLWEHAGIQAVCAVTRCSRLGWFLNEVNGPRNAEIEPPHLETIRNAFDDAGMPPRSIIEAVERIVSWSGALPRRQRHRSRRNGQPGDGLLQDLA